MFLVLATLHHHCIHNEQGCRQGCIDGSCQEAAIKPGLHVELSSIAAVAYGMLAPSVTPVRHVVMMMMMRRRRRRSKNAQWR